MLIFKIALMLCLTLICGCASRNSLQMVDTKVDVLQSELTKLSIKTESILDQQIAEKSHVDDEIKALKAKTDHIDSTQNNLDLVLGRIASKLTAINRKTDAISRKLLLIKTKQQKEESL